MTSYILQQDRLDGFLNALDTFRVFAPVKRDSVTVLEVYQNPQDTPIDLVSQPQITKKSIFPHTEELFRFDKKGDITDASERLVSEQTVVFGIRPCDAASFLTMDPVFDREFPDPYYVNRRKNTIMVALACNNPFPNCFCTAFGRSPFSTEGVDILLTDLGGRFLVEPVSEKSGPVIEKTASLLEPASAEDAAEKQALTEAASGSMARSIDLKDIPEKLAGLFEHPVWKELASKCTGCGICTYTCPTCYCFDIQDEAFKQQGRRVRIWDSCMYDEYTRHASGHNPRPTRAERLKNRIYHKFKYQVDNTQMFGCVGCGRCISLCPFNVDLIETLTVVKNTA